MIFDLNQSNESKFNFSFAAQPDLGDDSGRLNDVVFAEGEIRRGLAQVDVEGTIHGCVDVDCSRCLTEMKVLMKFPFKVAFVTEENYTQDKESEIRADDLDVSIYDGERIDLNEIVREQILLNLPAQHFCRADCRGLCPHCGANRSESECGCEEKEVDPRWSALKNLK